MRLDMQVHIIKLTCDFCPDTGGTGNKQKYYELGEITHLVGIQGGKIHKFHACPEHAGLAHEIKNADFWKEEAEAVSNAVHFSND